MKIPNFEISRFDLLNASVSALRDGVSSLYALYLINGLALNPLQIGWILSSSTAASLVGQIPLGFMYDRIHRKGLIVAGGALGMVVASAIIGFGSTPSFRVVLFAQIFFGLSVSTLSAGMPALTVAITKDLHLGTRLMRNEVFAKIGNLSTLALAGYLANGFSLRVIFVMIPVLAAPVIWLALAAPSSEPVVRVRANLRGAWLSSTKFYWFVAVIFLVYLTCSAALPIFEQVFAPAHAAGGAAWIATATALTMGTVTVTIFGLARLNRTGHLTLTLAGAFVLMAVRLGVLSGGPLVSVLVVGQLLDGVIDGILYTVPMRLLAKHFRADFAVLSGVLGATASLGALASTLASGPLMIHFGYQGALLAYLAPASLGLLVMLLARRPLGIETT